jgi:cytochrome c oxidase subunit 1
MGHFHLTLGTTVALTFMGTTYWILPSLLGRQLRFTGLARIQPYLWFLGMSLFSLSYHIAGLRGLPRRVYSSTLGGGAGNTWQGLTHIAAAGGVILFLSAMCFVTVVAATWLTGRRIEAPAIEFAQALHPVKAQGLWDRLGLWTVVAVVMILLAYGYPIYTLLEHTRFGSPGFKPF